VGGRRRTARDQQRRTYGQNFLTWPSVVEELLARADLAAGERIVEIGAGQGALTLPLAEAGARVTAIERDPVWARQLRGRLQRAGLGDRVRVICTDFRRFVPPTAPYRVVSNAPFGLSTALLHHLLDDPARGPQRADLLLQHAVAVKRARQPPATLQSAGWAPWWTFELGPTVPRQAFRPAPRVDAAWLVVRKRTPELLPTWLAADFTEALRPAWRPPQG
jgi:23S rRNA (adenine-N6)-dimethyltransferase